MYDFKNYKNRIEEIKKWLKDEYMSIRTGRATPSLLDKVKVNSYGTFSPISHIASLSIENARSIKITPYDKSLIKDIEKAITDENLGVSVSSDDTGVRVNFPELTSETRELLIKLAKQKHEQAYVSLKQARDEVWEDIQEKFKNGELTEDEKFKEKENMEKITRQAQEELKAMLDKKINEIKE